MTRFDADAPEDRQKLFAEAIVAHRERGSPFTTFEAHEDASPDAEVEDEGATPETAQGDEGEGGEDADGDESEEAPPWIQFGDGVLNLDCTDDELESLKSLLSEFPAFKIDDITRPEEAEGVNVRISALADPNRVAQCAERAFREVYGQPEAYRVWVTAV